MRPTPQPSSLSRPFWDACARHELTFLECADCGERIFPPVEACTSCLSSRLRWAPSRGRGHVYSYTVLRRAPFPDFEVPSVLGIVELDEGYVMFSNIVETDPSELTIGMPVEVVFEQLNSEITLPLFRRVTSRRGD